MNWREISVIRSDYDYYLQKHKKFQTQIADCLVIKISLLLRHIHIYQPYELHKKITNSFELLFA